MQIRNVFSLLIFATAAVFPICGHTQIQMFEPERVGRWYLSGAGGSFKQDTDADIGNYHGQYGLAIGAGYRLRPHLGLEIDGLFASQRFEIDSAVISTDAHASLTGIGGLVKPGGLFFGATLNRTAKSFALAIVGAEYVLGWLPRGTHQWRQFVRPSEFVLGLRRVGLKTTCLAGTSYDVATQTWQETSDLSVNYMLAARRT